MKIIVISYSNPKRISRVAHSLNLSKDKKFGTIQKVDDAFKII